MILNSALKDNALQSLKGRWTTAVVLMLVYVVLAILGNLIPFYIGTLLLLPLGYGFTVCFLHMARRQEADFDTLFSGYKDFGRIFLTILLQNIYTFLWTLLLVVPGIIKSLSYAMTPYVLRDNPELSNNAAIERSMAMMNGHKMELFLLYLSFIGWYLLGIITLGIGFLWITPYIETTVANFYDALREEQASAQPE